MVDISTKGSSSRTARAEAWVRMRPETLDAIFGGEVTKGDVLAVARVAGIQGAKRTSELIPLCHPLALAKVTVDFARGDDGTRMQISTECKVTGQTGVEMEALTAASVAALTVYDMCKSADRGMTIEGIRLVHKSGGKSGTWDLDESRS
jgi:cyclic pyranopterin monophosphate synthase